jgi:putative FmdB family regulatory protein
MPNYDYKCSSCSFTEEIFQSIKEATFTVCPNCGKNTFERVVTGGAGVLYKGEGWYVTDYSKRSSGGKEQSSSPTPAPESKPSKTSTPAPRTETPSKEKTS